MKLEKKKLLIAEIIICVVIFLCILLPQIIGTKKVSVEKSSDAIARSSELDGKQLGVLDGSKYQEITEELFPNSNIDSYQTLDELANVVVDEKDFGFLIGKSNVENLKSSYDALMPMPIPVSEDVYAIINKKNYKYGYTSKSLDDINKAGVTIAGLTGTTAPNHIKERYPNATIKLFNTNTDIIMAVSNDICDYGISYEDEIDYILKDHSELAFVYGPAVKEENSFATGKTEKGKNLCDKFNTFYSEFKKDGNLQEITDKWKSTDEEKKVLETHNYSGVNGELKIVTCGSWVPYSYYKNNVLSGIYIDVMNAFCEKYGYIPKYSVADYSAEIAGVISGEYDFMADVLSKTDERLQSVNFTDTIYINIFMLVTKKDAEDGTEVLKITSFKDDLKSSFNKNFIVENRWKMLLYGFLVTISLSILAMIFGTILGIIICYFRMNNNIWINAFARIYIRFLQGTPIVVLLMVLYYIVFAKTSMDAFVVCVIGFSIDFSVYVSEIFRAGIESVPRGQYLAAISLGFTKVEAFFNVVIPQALTYIIPVYSGQFVSMVKLTSVAGYISVLDLTKMSDLIRASTYEAFFPLISTAIIYFLLSIVLIRIIKFLENLIDPNKRKVKIKGVDKIC